MTSLHRVSVAILVGIVGCGGEAATQASDADTGFDAGIDADGESREAAADAPAAPPDTADPSVSYLIIAADALAESAKRYEDYRIETGHTVVMTLLSSITQGATDQTIAVERVQQHVHEHHERRDPNSPLFVLILGDADESSAGGPSLVPTGQHIEPDGRVVTSDNVYADMDGDGIPEVAVGRIPVSTDADVDRVREKVAHYESTYEVGPWNRRLSNFASTGGYGDFLDGIIEDLAFRLVESVSYDFDLTMTYAKQGSPYVYVPEQFSDKVYERINEGALLVNYVGHGSPTGFASLSWSGKGYPILDTTQLDRMQVEHKLPILTFVACSTGSFDTEESISERVIKLPKGPVTILSSTEESHPLWNAVFIHEFGQVLTQERAETVGEAFLRAKDRMVTNSDAIREEVDSMAGFLMTPAENEVLRESHLHMYTLFGDPGMRIAYPGTVESLEVSPMEVRGGGTVTVTASFGLNVGTATVTLEALRSRIPGELQPVPPDGDPNRDAVLIANYEIANDRVVAKKTAPHDGPLAVSLDIPSDLPTGTYVIKVYAEDGTRDAVGSEKLWVVP